MEPGPSILNMAEAMLQNDEYKSSHTSLDKFEDDEGDDNKETNREKGTPHNKPKSVQINDKRLARRSEGRTVVIQEPPKRRKVSAPFTPKEIVDALNSSISMEERLGSMYKAISAFDHNDKDAHNLEIQAGADIALVKMLAFLEFKTGFRRPPIQANMVAIIKEISLTCQALEMVYRASSESVEVSFNRVGTDLMQIVVILIDEEVKFRMEVLTQNNSPASAASAPQPSRLENGSEEDEVVERSITPLPYGNDWGVGDWDRDLILLKASKILGHFARVGQATRDIAHFPGLLGSILNLINLCPYDAVPWEARLSSLWTIANLACNTENMMLMVCCPDLVNSLVNVGLRQIQPMEPIELTMEVLRARSIVARAILNLSWPPENKIILSENHALVSMLSQLAVKRTSPYFKSKTMQDILVQTRRYAVSSLRNLAAAPRRSKIALCQHNNGKLLDVLTDVTLNEENPDIVDLAFAAIHNLAIHDTAEIMVGNPDLILALKNYLIAEGPEEESPLTPRSHASSTLLVLERSITPEMSSYENLRELLDAVNPTDTTIDGLSDNSENAKDIIEV